MARINPANAGFLLTGNKSKFIETNGALAWIFSCRPVLSPHKRTKKCYKEIPIWYKGSIQFVDTTTRKIKDPFLIEEISCSTAQDYVYHFDTDDPNSWYQIVPNTFRRRGPKMFSVAEIKQVTPFHHMESDGAGIFNKRDISRLIHRMVIGERINGVLKKLSYGIVVHSDGGASTTQGGEYWTENIHRKFYIDHLISPEFWKNQFLNTFGVIGYYLEKAAIFYAGFLLLQSIVASISACLRTYEIHKLTGGTVSITTKIASGLLNVFNFSAFLNELKSTYGGDTPDDHDKNDDHNNTQNNFGGRTTHYQNAEQYWHDQYQSFTMKPYYIESKIDETENVNQFIPINSSSPKTSPHPSLDDTVILSDNSYSEINHKNQMPSTFQNNRNLYPALDTENTRPVLQRSDTPTVYLKERILEDFAKKQQKRTKGKDPTKDTSGIQEASAPDTVVLPPIKKT